MGAQWVVPPLAITVCGLKPPPYPECSPLAHLDLRLWHPELHMIHQVGLDKAECKGQSAPTESEVPIRQSLNYVVLPAVIPFFSSSFTLSTSIEIAISQILDISLLRL